ncbi:hypothetical protein EFK50_09300 [Nocardioides marmoriginsengisoli]|uniref:DUF11 domain-containing protein n=1 Tax=Nocardioides marmoriginsengisoli TaxID=661483 RepID=A0A3N0CG91_9ACTN|nr:hypothetical protein EFK50_09300 [Nocardioides marmoriginsengisoli]
MVALVSALTASLALVASPAQAAGNGVLDLVISPVNQGDGTPITELSAQISAGNSPVSTPVTYKVQYSCATDVCDGTKVHFTPPPSDPWGLSPAGRSVLRYASWVAPAGGGTITGDDLTGKVVDLGNLAAGTSGTFSVTYNSPGIAGNDSAGGQFFPDGSDIPMSATATSDSASSKTSDTHLTWRIGTPTGPNAATTANQTIRPNATQVALISMSTGSERIFSGASIAGDGTVVATGDYKVVYHAPAQAVIGDVKNTATGAADPDAVVDHVNNTITWTKGSLNNPSYGARGGWGGPGLAAYNSGGAGSNNSLVPDADKAFWAKRSVELTYPVANFPEADGSGCNFRTAVTSSLDVSVHYLDSARTAGSKSVNATNYVACGAPFGGLNTAKDIVGGQTSSFGDGALPGGVYALNVPPTGTTDSTNRMWRVNAQNVGNVDGTVVIDEPNLDQDHIKVNRITATSLSSSLANWSAPDDFTATVEWTDNVGDTGTAELAIGEFVDAAAGRWFTSATTTALVPAGRILRADATATSFIMGYRFKVDDGAVPLIGEQRTNTADVSISYPADADGDGVDDDYVTTANGAPLPSRAVDASAARTVQYTQGLTVVNALFAAAPVVQGGGSVLPGTNVTFGVRGQVGSAWPGTSITPQTVFIAPKGWKIVPGSASFTAAGTGVFNSIPAGVAYRYGTGVFGTDTRDYVVATYPSPVALPTSGSAMNWPVLSATAYPTNAAVPGAAPVANVWAGEDSGTWYELTANAYATGPGQYRYASGNASADSPDVDADGNTTEEFVNASTSYPGLAVGASDGLSVVKQLCVPLDGAPDGCSWVSGPVTSGILAGSGVVKYRIQVSNAGNTALHGVVAYDVLPYVGDTGLLAGAPARGSQFALPLASVDSTSSGLTVTASGSTNPARPEVNPGASGTTNDWGAVVAGKKALRIAVDGELEVGAVKDVVFSTTLANSARQGEKACNSVAVDSNETLPAEPASTCVTLDAPLNAPPTVTIDSPVDGAELEYGSSVNATFTCADPDGNLASCVGTDENGAAVANGSALPTTTPGTHTLTVKATDEFGETATKTVTYTVKRKPNVPPTVDVVKPGEGATYFVGQNVPAGYSCADSDGTVVSCQGPVANGSNIDTATPGTKTFQVTATDNEGATASKTVTYKVVAVAGVCRGTALSLLGIGLGVANGKTTPCATATDKVLSAKVVITPGIPLLGVAASSVETGVLTAATQSGPGSAKAQAEVAGVKIVILGQTIEATGLSSSASSVLSSCGTPAALAGASTIASLKVNNKPIANVNQPISVPLIVGSLGLNERGVVGSTITQSALHLNVLGLVDLALGQSVAGATC